MPKELKLGSQSDINHLLCIAALFSLVDTWKQPRCLHTDLQICNGLYDPASKERQVLQYQESILLASSHETQMIRDRVPTAGVCGQIPFAWPVCPVLCLLLFSLPWEQWSGLGHRYADILERVSIMKFPSVLSRHRYIA